jgi:hypothetical protein
MNTQNRSPTDAFSYGDSMLRKWLPSVSRALPRWEFGGSPEEIRSTTKGAMFRFATGQLVVWTSLAVRIEADAAIADLRFLMRRSVTAATEARF